MVLDSYRSKADLILMPISKKFLSFNPNTISGISLVLAALGGIFYYFGNYFLIAAFLAIILSSLFDAVDGKVARLRNISSRKGDLIDHVFDRYSDLFILIGMAFSAYGSLLLGFLAVIGVMLTSYMGTQSQALGLKRNYSGVLGRADRLVLILVIALVQFFVPYSYSIYTISITATSAVLIWFAVAGNYTAIRRFLDSYRALPDQD